MAGEDEALDGAPRSYLRRPEVEGHGRHQVPVGYLPKITVQSPSLLRSLVVQLLRCIYRPDSYCLRRSRG